MDDPYALSLVGPPWTKIHETLTASVREPLLRQVRAAMVVRSRYAEDRLFQGAFTQFVILGAGLDSFAWRRPDVLGDMRVFEVDHPATQAWKLERADALGLPLLQNHMFAPVDFGEESLGEGLAAGGFDRSERTCFSWLGVTQYLTPEAIESTLRAAASCAPGSEIVFTYAVTPPFLDDLGLETVEAISNVAAGSGEPWQTLLSPHDAEALARNSGLILSEHLNRDDLHDRYFADRSDDLTPYTAVRFISATVPG